MQLATQEKQLPVSRNPTSRVTNTAPSKAPPSLVMSVRMRCTKERQHEKTITALSLASSGPPIDDRYIWQRLDRDTNLLTISRYIQLIGPRCPLSETLHVHLNTCLGLAATNVSAWCCNQSECKLHRSSVSEHMPSRPALVVPLTPTIH